VAGSLRSLRAWIRRLLGSLPSSRADRELDAELESHLQLHIDDNLRAGMSPVEARRAAMVALGGVAQTAEAYRDRRGVPILASLVGDVRYGVRSLVHRPGFTVAGIVILGLGIGANSAIFTLVNAVVLRPLPFADADRIVRLWQTPPPATFPGQEIFSISPANFIDWEAQSQVFEKMAIWRGGRQTLTGRSEPEAVIVVRASASFLSILGLVPSRGRGFTPDDDREGGPRTALLSERFFQSRFGGDPTVVGRTITLNRVSYEVIGVVPDAPVFINRAQVWLPLAWSSTERAIRNNHNYSAIAKLKPGTSVGRAQADTDAIMKRLQEQYPADNTDWGGLVRPLQQDLVGAARESLLLLFGAVALVLLIACANLANLMLVHTHARARELAVRTALGASRARIVQQLLVEGLVLGIGGGLVGLVVAAFGVDVLTTAMGTTLPRAGEVGIDGRVLAFTTMIAIATGLFAAFAPAWKLTGRQAADALRTGPARGHSGGDGRVRNLLVISEVALALMLLIGAGLLIRSLSGLRQVDPGFDPRSTLTALVQIPTAKYPDEARRNQFFADARQKVLALPGVESAAWIDNLPLDGGGSTQYVHPEGTPDMRESELPVVAVRMPSPGYFRTARIPLLAGRDFTDADTFGAARVVIVSERTARRFWPGEHAIGKHLTLRMMTKEPAEVIGVAGEVKLGRLDEGEAEAETVVYAPAPQFATTGATIVVRTTVDPASLSRALVGAIQAVDPEQPVLEIATMEAIVEESLGQRPFAMRLLSGFALLAVVLASVGIYSVLAYTVRQRVREIGIRMALGASAGGVLRHVLAEGMKPTMIGIALGLLLAALLAGVMRTLLFGVSRHDPWTFAVVTALMIVTGVVATIVPAYRATRVDPITALRAE
jgi:putative ABC transport system permease protein